jgi:hypothetical protein
MVDDRWEDDVFNELERLGTLVQKTDERGDVRKLPELRVVLEEDGATARVMDNRNRSFVARLPAGRVLPALQALTALVGTDTAIGALLNAAEQQDDA